MNNLQKIRDQATKDDIARLNVAAIIVNSENKILFCQRSQLKRVAPGAWHMPGGRVEEEESVEEAITRELLEELNLTTTYVGGYSGAYIDYEVGEETHRTCFVHVKVEGTPQLNAENDAFQYLALDEIPDYLEPHVLDPNLNAAKYGLKQ